MKNLHPDKLALVADIGGTKTNFGLFTEGEDRPSLVALKSYSSRDASSLEELTDQFLTEHPQPVSTACFGIAGPVIRGVCKTTNLPWVVSESAIKDRFGFGRVRLINDLAATVMAAPALRESEVYELNRGEPEPDGAIGVIAPGTGLGMALAVFIDGRIHTLASEGGHVEFAPGNDEQIQLLQHLLKEMPHVSVERLGSGPGLFTIYSWLEKCRGRTRPDWITEKFKTEDPSKVVSEAALETKDSVCVEALDLFVSIIGAAAGNLALTGMTTGGMYLGGGIPPKILPKLEDGSFMNAFKAKGRFEGVLSNMPVTVILNHGAALLGAACCALEIQSK